MEITIPLPKRQAGVPAHDDGLLVVADAARKRTVYGTTVLRAAFERRRRPNAAARPVPNRLTAAPRQTRPGSPATRRLVSAPPNPPRQPLRNRRSTTKTVAAEDFRRLTVATASLTAQCQSSACQRRLASVETTSPFQRSSTTFRWSAASFLNLYSHRAAAALAACSAPSHSRSRRSREHSRHPKRQLATVDGDAAASKLRAVPPGAADASCLFGAVGCDAGSLFGDINKERLNSAVARIPSPGDAAAGARERELSS